MPPVHKLNLGSMNNYSPATGFKQGCPGKRIFAVAERVGSLLAEENIGRLVLEGI